MTMGNQDNQAREVENTQDSKLILKRRILTINSDRRFLKPKPMQVFKEKMNTYSIKREKTDFQKVKISSSEDAYETIKQFYGKDIHIVESFFILLMNRANNTIGYVKVSSGGIAGTVADPIIIAKYAVDSLAKSIILAHNHPTGNKKPSGLDIDLTKKIKNALKLFDIEVLDHIILTGEDGYYSFDENGFI